MRISGIFTRNCGADLDKLDRGFLTVRVEPSPFVPLLPLAV
jgi:hypothetical protein